MKKIIINTIIAFLSLNTITLQAITTKNQIYNKNQTNNKNSIKATFDGYDGENFAFKYTDDDGLESYVFFDFATNEVLEEFDLKSDSFKNKNFEIVFKEELVTIKENKEEQEFTKYTIIKLTAM